MADKRKSMRQERAAAARFGATPTKGSGNGWRQKNDARTETESIEFKATNRKSYSLKLEDLDKAWREAVLDDRRMVFGLEFTSPEWLSSPKRYVVLTEDDYLEIRDYGWS